MKLIDLSMTGKTPPTKRIMVTLPVELFEALSDYAEGNERSGFVREAIRLLLGVAGEMDLGEVADHLLVSCSTGEDFWELEHRLYRLGLALRAKYAKTMN